MKKIIFVNLKMNKKGVVQDFSDFLITFFSGVLFLLIIAAVLELSISNTNKITNDKIGEVNIMNNELIYLQTQFIQGSPITSEEVELKFNEARKKAVIEPLTPEITWS